jgi:pimeloyl-ACP methyl ester carboxylesterase
MAAPAQFVSTAFVARDMVRVAEAHGESRVRFWGFSYGSVLGITFAAMFPDKVERLIVDGVCDTDEYYESELSLHFLPPTLSHHLRSAMVEQPSGHRRRPAHVLRGMRPRRPGRMCLV